MQLTWRQSGYPYWINLMKLDAEFHSYKKIYKSMKIHGQLLWYEWAGDERDQDLQLPPVHVAARHIAVRRILKQPIVCRLHNFGDAHPLIFLHGKSFYHELFFLSAWKRWRTQPVLCRLYLVLVLAFCKEKDSLSAFLELERHERKILQHM